MVPKIQLQLAEPVDVLDEAGSTVSTVGKLNVVLINHTLINCLLCVLFFFFSAGCFYIEKRVRVIYAELSLGMQVNVGVDCS